MPHDFQTKIHAVQTYLNCGDIAYVCRKYHISRISLWRWIRNLVRRNPRITLCELWMKLKHDKDWCFYEIESTQYYLTTKKVTRYRECSYFSKDSIIENHNNNNKYANKNCYKIARYIT